MHCVCVTSQLPLLLSRLDVLLGFSIVPAYSTFSEVVPCECVTNVCHLLTMCNPRFTAQSQFCWCTCHENSNLWQAMLCSCRAAARKRLTFLFMVEAAVQGINLVCYIIPNIYLLRNPSHFYSIVVNWCGWIRWTCWNTVSSIHCVICINAYPLSALSASYKSMPRVIAILRAQYFNVGLDLVLPAEHT